MTERSELSFDNERTLLAWVRTVIALLAVGCAIAQLGRYLEQGGRGYAGEAGTYCFALAIVMVGTLAGLLGLDDYHRRRVALKGAQCRTSESYPRSRALYPLAILIGIVGVSLVILMALWR
jgi:uncharacterized membrane protein YidH (DUF202 family)